MPGYKVKAFRCTFITRYCTIVVAEAPRARLINFTDYFPFDNCLLIRGRFTSTSQFHLLFRPTEPFSPHGAAIFDSAGLKTARDTLVCQTAATVHHGERAPLNGVTCDRSERSITCATATFAANVASIIDRDAKVGDLRGRNFRNETSEAVARDAADRSGL